MRLSAKRACGGVARHHPGRPQACGPRLVAHRLAHLLPILACGFRRLRSHVASEESAQVDHAERLCHGNIAVAALRLPLKIPRGMIFASRIRFSWTLQLSCNLLTPKAGSPETVVSNHLSARNHLIAKEDLARISPYNPSPEDQLVN